MPRITLIYGPKGAGKSKTILELATILQERGLRVGGFFQRVVHDSEAQKGYDLVRFSDHSQSIPLARTQTHVDEATHAAICSFAFAKDAFATGKAWIEHDATRSQLLLLDEISKLEVAGHGHAPSLQIALRSSCHLLLSVRADQLFSFMERFNLYEADLDDLELPAASDDFQALIAKIAGEHPRIAPTTLVAR